MAAVPTPKIRLTAAPPKKSNVAEVTAVNADGSCDAAVVCNEQLPAGRTCAGKCGAGAVVRALRAAQRQIVSWLKVPATLLDDAAPCTRLPKYPRAFNHQDCVQRLQAGLGRCAPPDVDDVTNF